MGERIRGRARGLGLKRQLAQLPPERLNRPRQQMDENSVVITVQKSQTNVILEKPLDLSNQPIQSTQIISKRLADINIGQGDAPTKENPPLRTRPLALTSKLGTSGKKSIFQANYMNIIKSPDWALLQYRVDFEPDEELTSVRKGMLKVHKDTLGPYMFDGSSLFTLKKLNPNPLELFSNKKENNEKIRVIIKFTNQVLSGDPQNIQFFNIILRQCIDSLKLHLVGRNYYDATAKVVAKEFNFEIWPGIITAIKQHETNLLMNIDIAHKVMRKETAYDLLMESKREFRNDYEAEYSKAIVGTTIITLYNNKTYRIDGVDFSLTPKSTFAKKDGNISFQKYYKERYCINIGCPNQPLLVSCPKARDIRGGRSGSILLIPELCNLTGLSASMRNNFQLMRALSDHTRIQPAQRIQKYYSFVERLSKSSEAQKTLDTWNLKIGQQLVNVPGRIFNNEKIRLGDNKAYTTDDSADWKKCFRDMPMKCNVPILKWAIMYPNKNANEIQSFIRALMQAANGMKLQIAQPMEWCEMRSDRPQAYVEAIENFINTCSPNLIMCVVPNVKADRYAAIKRKCYIDRSIPNQVVLAKNLRNKDLMSIASKIAIQMNCKLGGIPWSVDIPLKVPAMIVGFDVCHDTSKKFSFGAMVASINSDYSRYYSSVKRHPTGVELSDTLSADLTCAIVKFASINRSLPSRVIIYRDGVGDGNLEYVVHHEVELIKKVLSLAYKTENPPLTVCVVSKRINTRIFHQKINPPPGSVVDDVITVPDKYDFYLVSQSVRQGTVTPTSYSIIHDTSGLSPDHIQQLTYKMTHMYYNYTGTIRVPAPCQYAHKLAFLAGQYLHEEPSSGMNDLLYFL